MRTECSKCGKPLDGSHKSYCKACFAAYVKARRDADPEKAREYLRTWREKNPGYDVEWQRNNRALNPDHWREYYQKWRRDHVESRQLTRRKAHLKAEYLFTMEDFQAMMTAQEGRCLICACSMTVERGPRMVVIDHDHKTGLVRGLLCSNCNRAVGFLNDDPNCMMAAAAYVMLWQDTLTSLEADSSPHEE